jgi:benzoylsuccinyl-CoA thiolase BbsB subunit
MTLASIVAVGMAKFGRYPDRPLTEVGVEAVLSALADCPFTPNAINAAYVGTQRGGSMIGQRILQQAAVLGIPIVNVENACSSSATALHQAAIAINAGVYDVVLVIGCDKLSGDKGTLSRHPDDYEGMLGNNPPATYAMRACRYMHDYNVRIRDIAGVTVKNRKNAVYNGYALFREQVTLEQVLGSLPVADPLTLLQCCARSDGAAAVVLANKHTARKIRKKVVNLLSSVLVSGMYKPGFRDMTSPEITVRAAKQAYESAGLGPEDIDLAEVHDAFSIAEILYYEALGFCRVGEGVRFLNEGRPFIGGKLPVNASGGLLAKGHPPGATGIAQVVEAVWQLRGQAGARQVENARVALTHCTGGGVTGLDHGACAIQVLGI